jgi:hypothetical protein
MLTAPDAHGCPLARVAPVSWTQLVPAEATWADVVPVSPEVGVTLSVPAEPDVEVGAALWAAAAEVAEAEDVEDGSVSALALADRPPVLLDVPWVTVPSLVCTVAVILVTCSTPRPTDSPGRPSSTFVPAKPGMGWVPSVGLDTTIPAAVRPACPVNWAWHGPEKG